MARQDFELYNDRIRDKFEQLKENHPERLRTRLSLSWSNWGFGMEPLATSAARLAKAGITFIELHGNHHGPDLGYEPRETMKMLSDHGVRVAGICGMFSADNDLSSSRAVQRQAAVDYLEHEIPFAAAVGGGYLLVVPGAVGRPTPYDAMEFDRSVQTLRLVADLFVTHCVRAVIEPIRSAAWSWTPITPRIPA
jgi:D-psicose/D-tagatose/L-ribulose 3-epimerase